MHKQLLLKAENYDGAAYPRLSPQFWLKKAQTQDRTGP